jgi:hypothetical protein
MNPFSPFRLEPAILVCLAKHAATCAPEWVRTLHELDQDQSEE